MSSTKRSFNGFKIIDGGDISGDLTSLVSNVQFLDYGIMDISWTGSSPVGVINVEFLKLEAHRNTGTNTDVWQAIDFTGATGGTDIAISGASGNHQIIFNALPFPQIRVKYVRTSGSGSLTVTFSAKEG